MQLSIQFVYLFNEFLKRSFYDKKILKLINYKDYTSISKHNFSVFLNKNINMWKNEELFLKVIDNNVLIKDYRVNYIKEFFIKFHSITAKPWFYLKTCKYETFFLINDFKFRVNNLNFFILGRYIEHARLFYYNNYINSHAGLKELFNVKKVLKKTSLSEWKLQLLFRRNLWEDYYLVFKVRETENDFVSFLHLNLFFSIYKKYIKMTFLYTFKILVLFFYIFINILRSYVIINNYLVWTKYPRLFIESKKKKIYSVKYLYFFLLKIKMDFPFYFLQEEVVYLNKRLKNKFFSRNINSFFNLDYNSVKLTSYVDIVILDYISKLYYYYLNVLYYQKAKILI